jgi:hypothetical protein
MTLDNQPVRKVIRMLKEARTKLNRQTTSGKPLEIKKDVLNDLDKIIQTLDTILTKETITTKYAAPQ